MKQGRFANGLLIPFLLTMPARAQNLAPDTPQGFQSQYHAAFDAFRQHDAQAMRDRLDSFAIPSRWFTDSLVTGQSAEFARRYADEFADFKRRTAANFAGLDSLKARLGIDPGISTDIHARRWTPAEGNTTLQRLPALRVPLPPVQKFEVDYVLAAPGQSARLTSWIDSFIYIDGAFRFFGQGSKAFWSSPSPAPKTPKSVKLQPPSPGA
jgi:hypothetical protein